MKEKEYRTILLSAARLYGTIQSNVIFYLLKNVYKLDIKKKNFNNDLKVRSHKNTKEFQVYYDGKANYLIVLDGISPEECKKILSSRENKKIYYPKTYDDFIKYSDSLYLDDKDKENFDNLYPFLYKRLEINENDIFSKEENCEMIVRTLISSFKIETDFIGVMETLNLLGIQIKSEQDMNKMCKVIQNAMNNTRLYANFGYTPNELSKLRGPADINNVQLTIGPHMRDNMLHGITDPFKMLKEIENDTEMPLIAKESLKKELLEIIDQINHTGKA